MRRIKIADIKAYTWWNMIDENDGSYYWNMGITIYQLGHMQYAGKKLYTTFYLHNMFRFNKYNIEVFSQWNERDYDDYDGKVDYWNIQIILGNCSLFKPYYTSPPQDYLFR